MNELQGSIKLALYSSVFNLFLSSSKISYVANVLAMYLLSRIKVRRYYITDGVIINDLLKIYKPWSATLLNSKQYGFVICEMFIGNLAKLDSSTILEIFTTERLYRKMMDACQTYTNDNEYTNIPKLTNSEDVGVSQVTNITVMQRQLNTNRITYKKIPTNDQMKLINIISEAVSKIGYARVFIHGPPGTGKSTFAELLAQHVSQSVVITGLSPVIGHERLGYAHTATNQCVTADKEAKLKIILANEIDKSFEALSKKTAEVTGTLNDLLLRAHEGSAQTKTDWNDQNDDFAKGLMSNVVLIMTSNKTPEEIDAIDPAYLRKNRVEIIYEFKHEVEKTNGFRYDHREK